MVLEISGTGGGEQEVGEFLNRYLPHLEKIDSVRDWGGGAAGEVLNHLSPGG